jgi:broad specificity phosphatase PhoE
VGVCWQVRHAESTENVKIGEFKTGWDRLSSLEGLPSASEMWAGMRLLEFDTDSELSALGKRQLDDQCARMAESSFIKTAGIELVVHSPLRRARETCDAVFGSITSGEGAVPKLVNHDLRECKPMEHMYTAPFQARIDRFAQWLAMRDETTIALVGHGE